MNTSDLIKNPHIKLIGGISIQVFDEVNYHIFNSEGKLLSTEKMVGNEQIFISQMVCLLIVKWELEKQIQELTEPKKEIKVTDIEKQFPKLALALAKWSLAKEPHDAFNNFSDIQKALEDILNGK